MPRVSAVAAARGHGGWQASTCRCTVHVCAGVYVYLLAGEYSGKSRSTLSKSGARRPAGTCSEQVSPGCCMCQAVAWDQSLCYNTAADCML